MSRQYFAINFYDNCDCLVIEEIPMCNLNCSGFASKETKHFLKTHFMRLHNRQPTKLQTCLSLICFTQLLFHN